jgi:hypothetical protein
MRNNKTKNEMSNNKQRKNSLAEALRQVNENYLAAQQYKKSGKPWLQRFVSDEQLR